MVQNTKPHVFVNYIVYHEGESLPPIARDCLYEYVFARNGVFVRSEREGLHATIPVCDSQEMTLNGLAELKPEIRISRRVRLQITEYALSTCMYAMPNECLLWLGFSNNEYAVTIPDQVAGTMFVHPAHPYQSEGAEALIDIHSHDCMIPIFSTTDDRDETGFRIFAVVGLLDTRPSILVRVGIFGHFQIVPAESVFEMPTWLSDYSKTAFWKEEVNHGSAQP